MNKSEVGTQGTRCAGAEVGKGACQEWRGTRKPARDNTFYSN